MGLTRVKFELLGEAQYSRGFLMAEREAADLTEPLTDVGHIVVQSVGDQFHTEGARSARWEPLNRAYARWKDSHAPAGPAAPILVFSGDMRAAALNEKRAVRVTPRRMVYEIDDDKAIRHQQGDGHMPERKLVNLTAGDRRQIDRAFSEWLNYLRRGIIRGRR